LISVLGDKEAHLRPGGLRAGERQFMVSGVFLITSDRQHNLLVAAHGFPPEQHHLRIPIDLGYPGRVVQSQHPLIIANMDEGIVKLTEDTGFPEVFLDNPIPKYKGLER
jgi:hypothetical protein